MTHNKSQLLQELLQLIEGELQTLHKSVESASEAATHPESKPENKYDTRGLEASYLAGAQRERAGELKATLALLRSMTPRNFSKDDKIAPTAVIELQCGEQTAFYFLVAAGAGYVLSWQDRSLVTITPQSPIGKAVMGRELDDVLKVRIGSGVREYTILRID